MEANYSTLLFMICFRIKKYADFKNVTSFCLYTVIYVNVYKGNTIALLLVDIKQSTE